MSRCPGTDRAASKAKDVTLATNPPPRGPETQALIEVRLAEAAAEQGVPETVTVKWREGTKNLPVISMPVSHLYYNPDSRRLPAQRTLMPDEDLAAQEDPWSDAAQAYFEKLLKGKATDPTSEAPEFTRLREDLNLRGQLEPGIVTRDGILVNANTRRAALRELGVEEMRVAVLPGDASLSDREAIELDMQLRVEHRRPYSFINRLLALRKEVERGVPTQNVCKSFGIAKKTLERDLWILALIDEAVERSRSTNEDGSAVGLRLIDFEEDQGKLEEFHRAWARIPEGDTDAREALREARLAAVVLGLPKTSVRAVRDSFAEDELGSLLAEVAPAPDGGGAIPGLKDVQVDGASENVRRIAALTTEILQRRGREVGGGPADPWLKAVKEDGFEKGVRKVIDTDRLKKRSLAPAEALSDAVEDVRMCTDLLVNARAAGGADLEELEEQAASLREELGKLARQLHGVADPGDATKWLLSAAD